MSDKTTFPMEDICRLFGDAYQRYIDSVVDQDLRSKVTRFCIGIVATQKAYLLLTPVGLTHATENVFEDTVHHDFVMSVSFTFFSLLGDDPNINKTLIESLARGVSQYRDGDESSGFVAVPKAYSDRYGSYDTSVKQLACNRWLVVLLMIQLCLSVVGENKVKTRSIGVPR